MKIKEVTDEAICFDNGNTIVYNHDQDCCEWNYADFEQLDDMALNYDFDEKLIFEKIDGSGFRFGDKKVMFFVPCYSCQNGYYSSDIDIHYDNSKGGVIQTFNMWCKEEFY